MMANPLLDKADIIANSICTSDVAVRFWRARDKMEHNKRAQRLFETLKLKTNNSLGLQNAFAPNHPKLQQMQAEIQTLEQQLYEIPVAMQYKEAQAELNALMQGVMGILLSRLEDKIPVEMGPRHGCGQGPDGNGCNCGGEH
jgi:cell fate (sporulation/competence/biofilm development) regulator YmcA (YheA/YmcA/DUF963 family)